MEHSVIFGSFNFSGMTAVFKLDVKFRTTFILQCEHTNFLADDLMIYLLFQYKIKNLFINETA